MKKAFLNVLCKNLEDVSEFIFNTTKELSFRIE